MIPNPNTFEKMPFGEETIFRGEDLHFVSSSTLKPNLLSCLRHNTNCRIVSCPPIGASRNGPHTSLNVFFVYAEALDYGQTMGCLLGIVWLTQRKDQELSIN